MGTVLHRVSLFVATGALLLGACSSDSKGTTDKAVLNLSDKVGTCLLVGPTIKTEVSSLPTIDCAKEHTHEIYGTIVLTDKEYPVYPGTDALGAVAQRECTRQFEPYVGSGPRDTSLFYSWLLPTLGSWNNHKDRTILCVAGNFDSKPLIGTIQHSKL
jgi:hypothetical protein